MSYVIVKHSKFPPIQHIISGYYQIGDVRLNALRSFSEVLERVEAVLKFLYHFSPENNPVIKKAYLRAALSEFVSIEEVLSNDLNKNKIGMNVLKIKDTENPLFHLLKQLRNYNIHLGNSKIAYSDPVPVLRGNKERIDNGEAISWDEEFAIIDNFCIADFNKLRDSKYFKDYDKKIMIDWFNKNQNIWGVSHLIFLATALYCDEIIAKYNL